MGEALNRRRRAESDPGAPDRAEASRKAAAVDEAGAEALLARVRASQAATG